MNAKLLPFTLALSCALALGARASVNYTGGTYTQNFNGMGPTGTTTPANWFVGTGAGPVVTGTTVVPSTGSFSGPGNYNFGIAGANSVNDRALGSQADSGQRDTELDITNNTGFSLTLLQITYTGEQWRDGGSMIPNTLSLQLSTNGITWTSLGAAFNFTSPINLSAGPLDGNAPANRLTGIGGSFTLSTPIPNGATFYLRFADPDDQGKDAGLAIDDFRFRAVPEPSAYMLLGVGLLICGQRFLRRRLA
jgi:hypothetical protein